MIGCKIYDKRSQLLNSCRYCKQRCLQEFFGKISNSSGLKESEAVKIDAVLKGMKCSGNTTVVSEVQNESRRYLEYEIDF